VIKALLGSDPEVAEVLDCEKRRQLDQIELIASENIVSSSVREALGHEITNKTLEGYPGKRFHGGGRYVDVLEQLAIDRAKTLFGAEYVNVQPHSGVQANQAVFFSFLKPGDRVLSLELAAGGHLSHGAKANYSGSWFDAHFYTVNRQTELLDYDAIEEKAEALRPKLLIAGGSAYPRKINFERMESIAHGVGATLLVDMAHVAGLVAGGVYPSPVPYADIVTCTTTKTLRGPRGGLILSRDDKFQPSLQSAVFPGVQGSLHSNVLAAKAVCLGEALDLSFKRYAKQVVRNARVLAKVLEQRGVHVVSGGTDSHIVLLNLSSIGLQGKAAENVLAMCNITSNKNPVPCDGPRPSDWSGLRLGVAAVTTRGIEAADMSVLAGYIADLLYAEKRGCLSESVSQVTQWVTRWCELHPVPP